MLSEVQLTRICARRELSRADLITVTLFAWGHPETSLVRALHDFVRGQGPAAAARGRLRATAKAA